MDYRQVVDAAQTGQPATRPDSTSYLASINKISVFFALILGLAIWLDRNSAIAAVITAGITYGTVVVLLILFQPTAIPFIAVSFMREITIRRRDKMEFRLFEAQGKQAQQVQAVDRPRLPDAPSTAPLQLPDSPRFVPAVAPAAQAKADAGAWINRLFDDRGQLLPKIITPKAKQIQQRNPSEEAINYLESLNIVRQGDGKQLYWLLPSTITRREVVNLISTGRRAPYVGGLEDRVGVGSSGEGGTV